MSRFAPRAPPWLFAGNSILLHLHTKECFMEAKILPIDSIRTDGGTQVRINENPEAVDRYADALSRGVMLPPIHVFFDGSNYWPGDGYHRLAAHRKNGLDNITCVVHEGDRTAALEYACQANQEHGLPLSNADKQNIVQIYFAIPGNENKNNSAVAKVLGVSVPFIKNVRAKAGIKPSPASHVGAGSLKRQQVDGLPKPVPEGEELNRLNKSTHDEPGKAVTVNLPDHDEQEFATELLRNFDPRYLKSCVKYLNDVL